MSRYNRIIAPDLLLFSFTSQIQVADALASSKEGISKAVIIEFVDTVTQEKVADFVPPSERIAVFDKDGTLWSEKPFYLQLLFAIDRFKSTVPYGLRRGKLPSCSKQC